MDRTFLIRLAVVAVTTAMLLPAVSAAALQPGTEMVLPSVAHAPGRLPGSEFRTDVWVFNPGDETAEVEVFFYHRGLSKPPPPPVSVEVAPGGVLAIEDAVQDLFGLTDAVGGLRFVASHPVTVTARVYDVGVAASYGPSSTGTSGQFDAATPLEDAVSAGGFADIIGIRGVTEGGFPLWRTNVAFMNASAGSSQVRLTLIDETGEEPDGGWPARQYTLGAWEPRQLNDVFAVLGGAEIPNGRVRIEVLSGGPVVAMGSLLDGRTNDPSTIAMAHSPIRNGVYTAIVDKPTYDTPLAFHIEGGAVTYLAATLLITDEDVPGCPGGELAHLAGTLPFPVPPDSEGRFIFATGATLYGIQFQIELDLEVSPAGRVSGSAVTTISGSGDCDGSATWPVFGARVP